MTLALAVVAALGVAAPQYARAEFFGDLFGGSERFGSRDAQPNPRQGGGAGGGGGAELYDRIQRLEAAVRALNGQVEQLQYQLQQLQMQGGRTGAVAGAAAADPRRAGAAVGGADPAAAAGAGAGGAVDPNTTAVGGPGIGAAPKNLGSLPVDANGNVIADPNADIAADPNAPLIIAPATVGGPGAGGGPAAGGAVAGGPVDVGGGAVTAGAATTAAAGATDEFALAVGYIQRKDFELAETSLKQFIQTHPGDKQVGEANYWLGESYFQRKRYRDALEPYLKVVTDYGTTSRAPDSLLKLGISLNAIGEKENACATLAEISKKYPKAPASVKTGAEREMKRAAC